MRELSGKVAFITGGASGIGLAMAKVFGREGMQVMLADIEPDTLATAVEELRDLQVRADGVVADVGRRESVEAAARETIARFGKVHLVCNNAGVGSGGPFGTVPARDWSWVVDVNQLGVVYGMEVFAPLIESHGEGGHFVNTASMAGLVSPPGMEPYCASKFAVVAMSEGWAAQLAGRNIGVSILCPGFVKTRIHESRRNRPDDEAGTTLFDQGLTSAVLGGIPTAPVAERVLEAVLADEIYIFTHPEMRAAVEARFARILAAFDTSLASPALSRLAEREVPAVDLQNG